MLTKEQEQMFYLAMAQNMGYSALLTRPAVCSPQIVIDVCKDAYGAGLKKGEQFEIAYKEFHDKTEWVQAAFEQSGIHGKYWGMHRADAARELVDQLNRKNHELEGAYNAQQMRIAELENELTEVNAEIKRLRAENLRYRESTAVRDAKADQINRKILTIGDELARTKARLLNAEHALHKLAPDKYGNPDAFLSTTAQPAEVKS